MNKKQTGNFAEFMARVYLRLKGYHILEKDYITGRGTTAGEIDIIALKKNVLVFVEVKNRKTLENAFYAIKPKHPLYEKHDVRFDAIFVSGFKLRHILNAWGA